MQAKNVHRQRSLFSKNYYFGLIFIVLISSGLVSCNNQAATQAPPITVISQSTLEETYGLQVTLVAVTAAGGFVDVRLKVLDADKANLLLQDKNNYPALFIAPSDYTLLAPDDTRSQAPTLETGGNLLILYANARGIVKTGTPVMLTFGSIHLEPINAK